LFVGFQLFSLKFLRNSCALFAHIYPQNGLPRPEIALQCLFLNPDFTLDDRLKASAGDTLLRPKGFGG
jgi:hypothetical protein